MRRIPVLLFLCFLSITAFHLPESLAARNEVRDYERLRLLQQATGGGSSSGSSFETRVNALLDISSNAAPTYASQANEDARIAAETLKTAEAQKKQGLAAAKTPSSTPGQTPKNFEGKIQGYLEQTQENPPLVDGFVNGSEEAFQKRLQEEKEKQEIERRKAEEEPAQAGKPAPAPENSDALPSLANNPFYFGENTGKAKDQQDFENNKTLLFSRLIQDGYTRADARRMLAEAGSPEELILTLMNDGKTYGEASDMVRSR